MGVDHSLFVTAAFVMHCYWMYKTDYRNGANDLNGPFPRGGPHKKPRELVEASKKKRLSQ